MTRNDHWHVLGAGSMGCLWGAYLARAGYRVTLLLRDRAALAAFPGYLDLEVEGRHWQFPVDARVVGEAGAPIEQLLVAVKAPDTLDALASLRQRLDADSRLVLMQNGMGVVEQIRQTFPDLTVGSAVTTEGAHRTAPFRVIHAGRGQTWIDASLRSLVALEFESPTETEPEVDLLLVWYDGIKKRQWHKLSINCALNGLTALLDCRNGQLLQPPGPELIRSLCEETAAVMAAEGLEQTAAQLTDTALAVAEATRANISSMCQDMRRGVTTEIDYLNGYLLERARVHDLELPRHRMLVELIRLKTALVLK